MYFKRLEMHGFKSFAEPVVIDFHEGVTCIVGPNGSGKSNISDALRWVLGEQSPKMLRGGKMEEVIFSGTASRKSRGMAEVTLVIDNSSNLLPIDYNEVAITRRMYRSGESEYLINNHQCRLRDIRELIMDTGIGVDGYSIIGQGKIAEIVSSKPESRREIFEEAAGIVLYKSKKIDAEKKLSNTTGNLDRVNDIIGEIEQRIDGLKEDSEKAQEYLKLRDRYKELEINITLQNVERLNKTNEGIEEDIKALTDMISSLDDEKRILDENVRFGIAKNEELNQQENQAREKHLEMVNQLNIMTNKNQLDQERLSNIEKDFVRLKEEIKEFEIKNEREITHAKELTENKNFLQQEQEKDAIKLIEAKAKHDEITRKISDISDKISDDKEEFFRLHSLISEKNSEAMSLKSIRKTLDKRKEQLLDETKENEQSFMAYQSAKIAALAELEQTQKEHEEISNTLCLYKEKQTYFKKEITQLAQKTEEIRIHCSQLESRKKTIEEMEMNYEGYNGAVKFIMKANLPGVEGIVADLMKVPAGLEVAIETALGSGMQNVICQKDKDAKSAIQLLKQQKAGRLTFLPMESVTRINFPVQASVLNAKGFKGLASELVSYEKKHEGIFNYLLGRVAVVDTMDEAILLSKNGNGLRFVTLDGEIINSSGAITGGKYKNTTANLLTRKNEINRLEEEILKCRATFQQCNSQKEMKDRELESLIEDITTLESKKSNLELLTMNISTKMGALDGSLQETQQLKEKQHRELSSITHDFGDMDVTEKRLLDEEEDAKQKVQTLEKLIDFQTEQFDIFKNEEKIASEELTKAKISENERDYQIRATQQLLERVEEAIRDYQDQITVRNGSLKSLESEKESILFTSKDAEESYKKGNIEKDQLEEFINQITRKKTEFSESLNQMIEQQNQFNGKLNDLRDQKYQLEIKFEKNGTQLDTLKEKLWEEFEVSYIQAIEFKKQNFQITLASKESRDIKNRLKDLGDVNVGAIKEYEQVSERYSFLTEQRADILIAVDELQAIISDMDKTIKSKFKENFDQIVINFEEIFKELFGGGHAELHLEDEENPLESGIEIIAQPPGKKLQNINLMSGGEKTMTAIALMFAVLKTKPTPFCILDEVEAALDDANIDRFATYLKNFYDIQFAVVTHQKATMEHADVLYGVTMPEQGISKVLSLRLGDNFELAVEK